MGGNRHLYYLSSQNIESSLKFFWISQCFCMLGLIFGKLSVGFLIMRIGVPNKRMRLLLYFLMASQFISGSVAIIFVWAECIPMVKLWKAETPGRCLNPQILTVWTIINGCRSHSSLRAFRNRFSKFLKVTSRLSILHWQPFQCL